jgi:mediator of RNA polymerase II transcription subunit 5
MDPLVQQWARFIDGCLQQRIGAEVFDAAVDQLYGKSPLLGRQIATLLLRPRSAAAVSVDPRVIVYVERLLALKRIDASDVLASAFLFSRDRPPRPTDEAAPSKVPQSRWVNPPELEELLFHRLHKAFMAGERPVTNLEGLQVVVQASRWMTAMVTSHTSDSMIQAMAGIQQQPQQQSINIREALGTVVVTLIENIKILELLNNKDVKGKSHVSSSAHKTCNTCSHHLWCSF